MNNKEHIHLKVLSLGFPKEKLTFSNGIKSEALRNLNEKSKWCNGKVMWEFIHHHITSAMVIEIKIVDLNQLDLSNSLLVQHITKKPI